MMPSERLTVLIDDEEVRLAALKRLERFWQQSRKPEWARVATYLFRPDRMRMYVIYPVQRSRYWVVMAVNTEQQAVNQPLDRDNVELVAITWDDNEAVKLAYGDLTNYGTDRWLDST